MIIIPLSSIIPKCFRKKKVRTWVRTWLSVKKHPSHQPDGWIMLDPLKAGHAAAEIFLEMPPKLVEHQASSSSQNHRYH